MSDEPKVMFPNCITATPTKEGTLAKKTNPDPCAMKIKPRSPDEAFLQAGKAVGFTVEAFWRWGASDLLVNTTRGAVAEFIVSRALNCDGETRDSWGPYDLLTPSNIKLEVKSASHRQAWTTSAPSRIVFGIAPKVAWDSGINKMVGEAKRHADVYVFCLLENKEPDPTDPLNLDRWTFYLLRTTVLDAKFPNQKSIGLNSLLKLIPTQCSYTGLPQAITDVFPGNHQT